MDSIQSFKGYGKVDPAEEQSFRRKTRKRILILVISSVVLVAVIIGAVTGTVIHNRNNNKDSSSAASQTSPAASLKAVCSQTLYPDSCATSISAIDKSNTSDPQQLFKLSLQVVLNSLTQLSTLPETLKASTANESVLAALTVCETMFDEAIDHLNDSISSINVKNGAEGSLTRSKIEDLKTWLSTTVTDQETCLDALQEFDSTLSDKVRGSMKNSTEYASNSLAIVSKVLGFLTDFNIPAHRKLLGTSDFPEWVRLGDRKLLQGGEVNPKPNVTVAKDRSGDVETLKEAVAMIPKKSLNRFVIYVKAGTYVENVVLDKTYWNVMIYGDGKEKTIISGSLNFVDGVPTFSTATFAIAGKGFMAKDMGFKNTAGAAAHQAVAFRCGSDFSVFYRCSFDAFQDTLYSHSNRQFYRECDITGTVDFIFGNAAVVYQSCNISPRQPMANQFVTITAQGKKDPNQNTGISIQRCTMAPLDNLNVTTYLGRPWKDFSTTVIMQSTIGGFLDPKGWIEWVVGVEPPKTINYAEYVNRGPGADVANRVKWAGYKPALTAAQASKFTVESFIMGASWLPSTNVNFQSSL